MIIQQKAAQKLEKSSFGLLFSMPFRVQDFPEALNA